MKRCFPLLITLILVTANTGCEWWKKDPDPVHVTTNKEVYSPGEQIILEVTNNSELPAQYFYCNPYQGNAPIVYRLENYSWNHYWSTICDSYLSYCCKVLHPGEVYRDTLNLHLDEGAYWIGYLFIIEPHPDYRAYFARPIRIK